jgi:NADPH:quinone reductase-like Zn-dependent oxidoreductase
MKAMRFRPFGGLDTLAQVEWATPAPGAGEVLINVAAFSINPVDWKLRSGGLRWIGPLWFSAIPCFDYAGRVAATGAGVDFPRVGDRVFGLCRLGRTGSACEFIIARPDELAAIPANVSFEQAAGVPLAGMTALVVHGMTDAVTWGTRASVIVWGIWGMCAGAWVYQARGISSHSRAAI